MSFQACQYQDTDTGRCRWAVMHAKTRVWYFPSRYGRTAAERLARKFNRQI